MPPVRLPSWIWIFIVSSSLFGTSSTQSKLKLVSVSPIKSICSGNLDDHVDKKPPSNLPRGVDDNMIGRELGSGSVSRTRHIIKSGSGSFRRIREEDREAADLALRCSCENKGSTLAVTVDICRLLNLAEKDGLDFRLVDEDVEGVSAESSNSIQEQCPWENAKKPRCDPSEKYRRNNGECNNLVRRQLSLHLMIILLSS